MCTLKPTITIHPASTYPPPPPPASQPTTLPLVPGFRFHPTDEELISYFLKRKVSGRPLRLDAIAEVDLYRYEPWELPAHSRIQNGDTEWYFFCRLDRKYDASRSSRANRATSSGYWKTTGKDRHIRTSVKNCVIGAKKTLVFHAGRAPVGQRTNWVMHEYRLTYEEPECVLSLGPMPSSPSPTVHIPQDTFVVCKIFHKSGLGPQNGAQYGAPFVEEEWEGADKMASLMCSATDDDINVDEKDYKNMDIVLPVPQDIRKDETSPKNGTCEPVDRLDHLDDGHVAVPNAHSSMVPCVIDVTDNDDNDEGAGSNEDPDASKKSLLVKPENSEQSTDDQYAAAEALTIMGENSKKGIELTDKKVSSGTSFASVGDGGDQVEYSSIEDQQTVFRALDALNQLEGIDGASYAKATKIMHDDPLWRRMFLHMPIQRQRDWVLNI